MYKYVYIINIKYKLKIIHKLKVTYKLDIILGYHTIRCITAIILPYPTCAPPGMARLFYHCPTFGVLDECTNATSADVEASMYQHAQSLGISLITVTQRTALIQFHDLELRLIDGKGGWEVRYIRRGEGKEVGTIEEVTE